MAALKATDAVLFVGVAVFTAAVAILSTEEAGKHIDAKVLFFVKSGCALTSQGFLALKLLRFQNGDGDGKK